MDKENIKDKVERIKAKAQIFLDEKIKAFVEDSLGNYYFCNIIKVEDNYIFVKGFAGKRKHETDRIFFIDIYRLEEYQEIGE